MRIKAIAIGAVLLAVVVFTIEQYAPEWRAEARTILRELARALR